MNFFENYPVLQYMFGTNGAVLGKQSFQNLATYSDVVDQIKDQVTAFSYYNVLEGDRPDALSQKFYGRPDLHWTFWLMNDHIRESGWPLTRADLNELLDQQYNGVAVVTRTDFFGSLPEGSNIPGPTLNVGDTLTGSVSGVAATVTELDVPNGQIFLSGSSLYTAGETATWRDADNVLRSLVVQASTTKVNSIHHVEDANGDFIDYDPTVGPGALDVEITVRDDYVARNEALREIKVIQPEYVEQVAAAFIQSLEG